ncbi:MAG TPA: DUF1178 family protein [Methylocella sp.]|nr:DUF1178 family protein [Methylocella sp.]
MIKFALHCSRGHEFESWFQSGAAFDQQSQAGHILCPYCLAGDVTKAIMAPALAGKGKAKQTELPVPAEGSQNVATLPPLSSKQELERRMMISALRQRILAEAEDVGRRFAEEARKIHEGSVEERPIHGEANLAEARALIEDGITILPLPSLPEEMN